MANLLRSIPLDAHTDINLPLIGDVISEGTCFDLAIRAALVGIGQVDPNPLVGAVAVGAKGEYLASAGHLKYGELHAEANLIRELEKKGLIDALTGGCIYVTLEPCAHSGKTPSCALLLAKYPIKKVVYAQKDLNPVVNGRGLAILEKAGILCEQHSAFEMRSKFLTDRFVWSLKHEVPYFGLKAAVSLDGSYAMQGSQRQWITSERSRTYGHWLRALYGSILIGSGTLALDNPKLDVRFGKIPSVNPVKIIFDPKGSVLRKLDISRLEIFTNSDAKIVWIADEKSWQIAPRESLNFCDQRLVNRISLTAPTDMEPSELLEKLYASGLKNILLEGGGGVWGQFLNWRLANKLHLFSSPASLVGGRHWLEQVENSTRLQIVNREVTSLGNDLLLEGDILYE
ncbi:MAG: bifunctional diaminohydroxyphosphoribosylaminopyrimidine deaminase/5-amino-6-(5-phosphoribosylamino)uracil reductase RibD [Bdellovibrionota bacterium]